MELHAFDKEYVERLVTGDPSTEQHFFAYFAQILGIMLRARMLPPERVDDIRQETFARVIAILRREGGIREPEKFGAFVNSVCKNVMRENTREHYKSQPLTDSHLEPLDRVVDLEDSLIAEESRKDVREILGEMNERDRDLLRAIFLEEGDKDLVCQRFGVDRNYLRVRLHRAKERFRAVFGSRQARALTRSASKGTQ